MWAVERLQLFGQSARDAIGQSATIGDADTADLFTEISRGIDHQLWLVDPMGRRNERRRRFLRRFGGRSRRFGSAGAQAGERVR